MLIRKLIYTLLIISFSLLSAQLRIGADAGAKYSVESGIMETRQDMETGFTLGYDHLFNDNFGAGFEYQLNREIKDSGGSKLGFTSIYGVAKYPFSPQAYGVARVGYAVSLALDPKDDLDASGGLMFGIGGGFNVNENIGIEAGYYLNNGTLSYGDEDFDIEVSRLHLGLAYSF